MSTLIVERYNKNFHNHEVDTRKIKTNIIIQITFGFFFEGYVAEFRQSRYQTRQ